MKVYSDRNNIQLELIRLRKDIDFSAVGKFQVWQQFIKLGSLSPPFAEERASRALRHTAVEQEFSFPANKQRRLWTAIDGYNERVHRKKQHAI